jgi:hypothetical protein
MNLTQNLSKQSKATLTLVATLISTTAIFTAPARADDYAVVYPGAICQPIQPALYSSSLTYFVGLYVGGSQDVGVNCPIERRAPSDDSSNAPWAAVQVSSANNKELSCRLSGYDTSGNYLAGSEAKTTYSPSNGNQYTYIYPGRPSSRGYYALTCNLPPGSALLGFVVYK